MWRRLTILLALIALVAACGGSGGETGDTSPDDEGAGTSSTTQVQPEDDATVDQPGDDEPAGGGDAGGGDSSSAGGVQLEPAGNSSVSVDGTPLTPEGLLRCIPFGERDDDLDLQVIGDGFILFIYIRTGLPPTHELTIQGRAVGDGESTGVFGGAAYEVTAGEWTDESGQPVDGPPFEYTGDRVSGSLLLEDIFEAADPIDVTFDVPVPATIQDCSL
jgi:hypothetical protein